ncbi:Kiwa anti-phage protein KwaB-like domain-containing protein [Halobacillus seohaensis]|uniref:Kiwa anti-phage protein KwaB-like domain-containing protein n=1 Tax=Halobacillus seohaensis TaxID=447421 RepID=A0ABW2ER10_9BACI
MELNEIISEDVIDSLEYKNSLTCKYNTKGDEISASTVSIPDEIVNYIVTNLKKKLDYAVDDYDPEYPNERTILKFDKTLLIQHETFMNFLYPDTEEGEHANPNFGIVNAERLQKPDKIDFVVHIFKYGEEEILIFTKHSKPELLKKIYWLQSQEDFKKIDKDRLYVFKDKITCLYYGDYYIYDKTEFHQLFKYWEKLEEVRDNVVNHLEREGIVSNLSEYRDKYKKHYNMQSIIKIDTDNVKNFIKTNEGTLEDICDQLDLDIKFDKSNNQFEIEDEKGITILNRILSYRSGFNLTKDFVTFSTYQAHGKL